MRLAVLLLLILPAAAAQDLPQNWAAAGASYTDRPAAWFSYATLISGKAQLYSFTTHDIFLVKDANTGKQTITSSVRSGIATPFRTIGKCTSTCLMVLGLGDAGAAAGGSSVGGAFSGGGVGILRLGKTNWTIAGGGRMLKTSTGGSQAVYEFGIGRIGRMF